MKKLLVALLVVSAIGATSCKKEVETVPAKTIEVKGNPSNGLNKNDTTTWD